ncbi:hypothetical protein [Polynucleobacter sp. Fuers-14]|uniref:hypothetical protein n=1 Tax=Polynucleobacter sp. Fuers-14 TaxID=1758364 RepID=UPI001C0E3F6A|nr:hypothetical protein [Polynucleobacter sp. Fuers-14]MBU3640967.1 hypothetical protein [Polynucleobacter sp. Fuers-14]
MNALTNTSPRDQEDLILNKCVAVSLGRLDKAADAQEANVFRVASLVLQSTYPNHATKLAKVATVYFDSHPGELVQSAQVIRNRWVVSLPRLRDMLSSKFKYGVHA